MKRRPLERLAESIGFPPGLWRIDGDGLLGTYNTSGQLVSLQWHTGDKAGNLCLTFSPRARSGVLSHTLSSGSSEDRETCRDGKAEEFDAWSDNLGPRFMSWRKWIQRGEMRLLVGAVDVACAGPQSRQQRPARTASIRGTRCARAAGPTSLTESQHPASGPSEVDGVPSATWPIQTARSSMRPSRKAVRSLCQGDEPAAEFLSLAAAPPPAVMRSRAAPPSRLRSDRPCGRCAFRSLIAHHAARVAGQRSLR